MHCVVGRRLVVAEAVHHATDCQATRSQGQVSQPRCSSTKQVPGRTRAGERPRRDLLLECPLTLALSRPFPLLLSVALPVTLLLCLWRRSHRLLLLHRTALPRLAICNWRPGLNVAHRQRRSARGGPDLPLREARSDLLSALRHVGADTLLRHRRALLLHARRPLLLLHRRT